MNKIQTGLVSHGSPAEDFIALTIKHYFAKEVLHARQGKKPLMYFADRQHALEKTFKFFLDLSLARHFNKFADGAPPSTDIISGIYDKNDQKLCAIYNQNKSSLIVTLAASGIEIFSEGNIKFCHLDNAKQFDLCEAAAIFINNGEYNNKFVKDLKPASMNFFKKRSGYEHRYL